MNRIQKYKALLNSYRQKYNHQQLNPEIFIHIITSLQSLEPLINYQQISIFQQIYQLLSKKVKVTIYRVQELIEYMKQKNKNEIIENDIKIYQQIVEKYQSSHIKIINAQNFIELLSKENLNVSLKQLLISKLQELQIIQTKKLKSLIARLKFQINEGKMSFIQYYDLKKSIDSTTKYSKQSDFSKKSEYFFELLEFILIKPQHLKILSQYKVWHQEYINYNKNKQEQLQNMIQSLKQKYNEECEQLEQQRQKNYYANEKKQDLENQLQKMNRKLRQQQQIKTNYQKYIIECEKTIRQTNYKIVDIAQKFQKYRRDHQMLQNNFEVLLQVNKQIQKDNENLAQIIKQSPPKRKSQLKQKSMKQEYNQLLDKFYECQKEKIQINKVIQTYKNQIQNLQWEINNLRIEKEKLTSTKVNKYTLKGEGVESYYSTVKCQNIISDFQQNYRNSNAVNEPINFNNEFQQILEKNKLKLSVWNQMKQSQSQYHNLLKSNQQNTIIPNIKIDLTQIISKFDYAGIRNQPCITDILQNDRESANFYIKYEEKRFLFFTQRIKIIRQSGAQYKFFLVASPITIYFIEQNLKPRKEDKIMINSISKIVLCDNMNWLIIKGKNINDVLIEMRNRTEFVTFIIQMRKSESNNEIKIQKQNEDLTIIQNNKSYSIKNFNIFSPYKLVLEFCDFFGGVRIQESSFYRKIYKEYFMILVKVGILLFKNQDIQHSNPIVFLPVLPSLKIETYQDNPSKQNNIKIQYKHQQVLDYELFFYSPAQKLSFVTSLNKMQSQLSNYKYRKCLVQKQILHVL